MAPLVFSDRLKSRTKAFESIAVQWKQDHQDAMFAFDVDELVAESIDQFEMLRDAWERTLQRVVDGNLPSGYGLHEILDFLGDVMLEAFDRTISTAESVQREVEDANHEGYTICRQDEFRRAFIETKKIRHRIKKSWPFTDVEGMSNALNAFREGRTRNIEDIIDEIQGRDS